MEEKRRDKKIGLYTQATSEPGEHNAGDNNNYAIQSNSLFSFFFHLFSVAVYIVLSVLSLQNKHSICTHRNRALEMRNIKTKIDDKNKNQQQLWQI